MLLLPSENSQPSHPNCTTSCWKELQNIYVKPKTGESRSDLAHVTLKSDILPNENLPPFPVDINQPKLMAFVDTAYANSQQNWQSTTGFAFTYCGGAIVYRSKTQPLTAISSTEAEFLAAVSCAKIFLYLWLILYELGFEYKGPIPIYKDNTSTIVIVNSSVPTERAWHIYVQHFAIQNWKGWDCIKLIPITGILNPSNDLTKLLGWVLHSCHCCQFMGHYA